MTDLYRQMLRIRMVEERISELYAEQEIRCPVHLCIGQEAAAVGAISALRPDDYVFSGHRSHGHYLAKGGDLKRMMAELYGKDTGCTGGWGGSMHLIDKSVNFMGAVPIVGAILPIAAGCAFASKLKGDDRVTMVFIGDAVVETGVFHETLNFAALHSLPLVIVCEDNGQSVNSPMEVRQPHRHGLYQVAQGSVHTHHPNGSDVDSIHESSRRAVDAARKGRPGFIEIETNRRVEHCGPTVESTDDLLTDRDIEIVAQITAEIDQAVAFAKHSRFPVRHA